MKFTLFSKLVLAASVLAAGGVANASLIDAHTFSLAPATTEVNNYQLILPKFDSSLGTLLGVTLYFRATESVTNFTLTNNGTLSEDFDATITSVVNRVPGNTAVAADKFGVESVYLFDTMGPACGTVQPGACGTITLASGASSGNFGPFTVNNTDAVNNYVTGTGFAGVFGAKKTGTSISNYIASVGNTTFSLTGSTLISTNFLGGGGNIQLSQSTTAGFQAEVDYTYDAAPPTGAPEPAMMGLMGSALLGLVALRKRFAR